MAKGMSSHTDKLRRPGNSNKATRVALTVPMLTTPTDTAKQSKRLWRAYSGKTVSINPCQMPWLCGSVCHQAKQISHTGMSSSQTTSPRNQEKKAMQDVCGVRVNRL